MMDICIGTLKVWKSIWGMISKKFDVKYEDTIFIIWNKYLCVYKDNFGVKILRDDCALST